MLGIHDELRSDSFLEYAFLRYVLEPLCTPQIVQFTIPQYEVKTQELTYYIDYLLVGQELKVAIELDGFAFHSDRAAFSYDRLRQNDLQALGYVILRFSYDNIRKENGRCIQQLQAILDQDTRLVETIRNTIIVPIPDMDPSPLFAIDPSPTRLNLLSGNDYFIDARHKLNLGVLRLCQIEALQALTNYFASGGQAKRAACVMSVGAGKTVLGITSAIAFTQRRAMIVTPSNVIRGTFDKALDKDRFGNALHHLPTGPLIPGCRIPRVLILDGESKSVRKISRDELLRAEIIVTNYHVLGDGTQAGDLLTKLDANDIDFLIIDEAHIAAAPSYMRLLDHFSKSRSVLMSACFQRMDGKPIPADVVYQYRLIDAINDRVAKNLVLHRFVADPAETTYEVVYPNGINEEIFGRDALLELIDDERKITTITAKSLEPIRKVMALVREYLTAQAETLKPVKPRVLFAALGEGHAAQIAQVAREFGIPCAHLHYSMGGPAIKRLRERFERSSGDLQGLVHLKMLGQGYDFPPITVVVPMRPYGSFAEFYQFIGRGIRVLDHQSLDSSRQVLDVVFHSELGLEEHLEELRAENDSAEWATTVDSDPDRLIVARQVSSNDALPNSSNPEIYVLQDIGVVESGVLHSSVQLEQRRKERELDALATAYSRYVATSSTPVSFEEYVEIVRQMRHE